MKALGMERLNKSQTELLAMILRSVNLRMPGTMFGMRMRITNLRNRYKTPKR